MTGRRLPLSWPSDMRASPHTSDVYTLLDAAALATTSPLDFSDPASAPDFTCLSFYKIFGSPDLGALIIRTAAGPSSSSTIPTTILSSRRYFGGGTVDMVTTGNTAPFHAKRSASPPHAHLEDGTLPFHSIIALSSALATHAHLYTSMRCISAHTSALTAHLHASLSALHHASSPSSPLLTIYNDHSAFANPRLQGPMIAFNVLRRDGRTLVPPAVVERAADACRIYVRSGSLCNPGGAARYLGWEASELRALYERDGLRCSDGNVGVVAGRATGVVRASLGAASTRADVDALVGFLRERFGGGGGGGRETGVEEEDGSGEGRSEEEDAVGVAGKERAEDSGSTEDSSAEEGELGGKKKKKTEGRRWMMMRLLSSCHRGIRKSPGLQQQ